MSGATLDTVAGGSGLLGLLGFRANGCPVQAGMSYTVGEMDREMFIPNQNGRIVPIESGSGGRMWRRRHERRRRHDQHHSGRRG